MLLNPDPIPTSPSDGHLSLDEQSLLLPEFESSLILREQIVMQSVKNGMTKIGSRPVLLGRGRCLGLILIEFHKRISIAFGRSFLLFTVSEVLNVISIPAG